METTDEQTSEIEKQQSHAVGHGNNKRSDDQEENSNGPHKLGSGNTKCGLCVRSYPHQGTCPSQGKKCMNCCKLNHFAKVCCSKPINRSKPTHSRKPLKGKHRASFVDSKGLSDDEALTPATAERDGSKEYTFTAGAQEPQQPNLSFRSI